MSATPRRRPGAIALVALGLGTAIVVVAVVVLAQFVSRTFGTHSTKQPPAQACVATSGDWSDSLDLEQSGNAAIVTGESIRRGLPARAATLGLVTAMQESWLRNLDYGDLDSLGLFQQRPSQGWGTPDEIMDPWYASGAFYAALVKVPDWQTGDINDVAQAVQRSGVPDGYRAHESDGRAWASVLTGNTPAGLSCVDRGTAPGDPAVATALLRRVYGDTITIVQQGTSLVITTPDSTTAWAVAQLTLANTGNAGVVFVRVGPQRLTLDPMSYASWQTVDASPGETPSPDDTPLTDDQVRIALR